jgi:23S rRNA (pseudouridine1915-N3)-methyltransferase
MQLRIVAIGRLKNGPQAALIDEYCKRVRWKLSIEEFELASSRKGTEAKAHEGQLLGQALAKRTAGRQVVLALDENGSPWSSREFAAKLMEWRDQGVAETVFMIGGADGLDTTLLSGADVRLCLGRMTWPHALARVLLVEQIYRAQQIALGHPYHRD